MFMYKGSVFWDVTPCSPLNVNRHFGAIYRQFVVCFKLITTVQKFVMSLTTETEDDRLATALTASESFSATHFAFHYTYDPPSLQTGGTNI
jgi:hypothetical protein